MITYKQLTLAEIFEDCQNKFDNDKYQFLSLFDEAINLDEIVPVSFISHFYASTGRPRKHQLYPMLKALLIQRIFSIPTDTLLIVFLKYSQELRDFCGFDVVPNGSKFTRFKQDFLSDLQSMFERDLYRINRILWTEMAGIPGILRICNFQGVSAWCSEYTVWCRRKSCQFHFWCKSCRKCCRYFPDPVYQLYQSRGTCIYLRHQF